MIIFNIDNPIVIRVILPHGFNIETLSGKVLFTTSVRIEDAKIKLIPKERDYILEIECNWIED